MGPGLRRIVGAPKSKIKLGGWHTGKVPKKDFPMAGASFRWCVIIFEALGVECRVLVILNAAKEKYEAILGVMSPDALKVLCSYEYHAGEPGWHCHAACDDLPSVPLGYMRGPWVRRLPHARKTHSSLDFEIKDETAALRVALTFYKIETQGTLI
jgi:hypothetical protein